MTDENEMEKKMGRGTHTHHTQQNKRHNKDQRKYFYSGASVETVGTVVVSPSTFNLDIGAVRRWIAAAAAARRHRC